MKRLPILVNGEEAHAHARHTGHRGLDLVLALCAIFISVISLVVAIEHGHTERQLVAANSWPFLEVSEWVTSSGSVRMELVNNGVGPAKLESFEVLLDGKPVPSSLALLERCCGLSADTARQQEQIHQSINEYAYSGGVIRQGERKPFFLIQAGNPPNEVYGQLLKRTTAISFRACYCSVFDECWMSPLIGLHPKPVAACAESDSSYGVDSH